MSRFLAFDIEIAKSIPNGSEDWKIYRPFGISCAATLASDTGELKLWYSSQQTQNSKPLNAMTVSDLHGLIAYLSYMVAVGYKILTWNGAAFDFDVLAEESGNRINSCTELARGHVDMMFHIFCLRGHFLGLDKAAKGMGLAGKTKDVNGAKAPEMWRNGQYQTILDYCAQDVKTTLALAYAVEEKQALSWVSDKGRQNIVNIERWLTVEEALALPEPDTDWMKPKVPPKRSQLLEWMTCSPDLYFAPSARVINYLNYIFELKQSKGQDIPEYDLRWLKRWQSAAKSAESDQR